MRYRIYDNVDKKYIPEEHAKHFFCLDIYGKVVKYNHVLGFMETGDRYTVEESTGLKDKNGVEIYVGDRIKCKYDKDIMKVNDLPNFYGWQKEFDFESDSIEIIGNIHGGSDER